MLVKYKSNSKTNLNLPLKLYTSFQIVLFMPSVRRGGVIFAQTTIQIPESLRNRARENGISLSGTLAEALETRFEKEDKAGAHVAKQNAPTVPSPLHKENET